VNDTVGTATPDSIHYLVSTAKDIIRALGKETLIGVHCHDDFGLATANTIAGVKAGADFADVAVNGLGERAGNADLTQVVVALTLLYGIDCGIAKLDQLYSLSRYVADIAGIPVSISRPLIGDYVFSDLTDNHNVGFTRNPYAFQSLLPEVLGNWRRVVISKKTGPFTLDLKLVEQGLTLPEANKKTALEALHVAAISHRGQPLPDAECRAIILAHGGNEIKADKA